MSSSRQYYAKKPCPFCGEVGSLEVDTVEAEVFCTECAMVIAGGLEEDEATRYLGNEGLSGPSRTDGVAADGDDDGGHGGGGSLMVSTERGFSNVPANAVQFLKELDEKINNGDKFSTPATSLFEEMMKTLRARTGKMKPSIAGDGGELAMASACYMITSARRFSPFPVSEIYHFSSLCGEVFKKVFLKDKTVVSGNPVTPPFTELNVLTKRSEIAKELDLSLELAKLAQREHRDLSAIYLSRLQWPLVTYINIVASTSKALNGALEGTDDSRTAPALGTAEAVCVGLFLCKTSKAIAKAMGADPVPQDKVKDLLSVVCWASHLPKTKVWEGLKRLNGNPAAQTKIAAVGVKAYLDNKTDASTSSVKASPSAFGVKRERD